MTKIDKLCEPESQDISARILPEACDLLLTGTSDTGGCGPLPAEATEPIEPVEPIEPFEEILLPKPGHFAVRAGLHAMAFSLGALLGWSGAEQVGSRSRAFESATPVIHMAAPVRQSERVAAERLPALAADPPAGDEIKELRAALEKERQAHAAARAQADEAIAALARSMREPVPSSAAEPADAMETAELAAPPNPPPVVVPQAHPSPAGKAQPTGLALLEAGRDHFRKGKLEPAREAFQKAAQLGLPEGALGVGTTYDPKALAKAGFTQKGEPDQARRWYRRAYQLSQGSELQ